MILKVKLRLNCRSKGWLQHRISRGNQRLCLQTLLLQASGAESSHSLLWRLSWKESQLHLFLLSNLRFDDLNLFTRFKRLSLTTVNCVDDLGLCYLANFVGSRLLCLSLLKTISRRPFRSSNSLLRRLLSFLRKLPSSLSLLLEESMKLLVQNGTF